MLLVTNSRQFQGKLKALRGATDMPFQKILKAYLTFVLVKVADRTPVSIFEQDDPGRLQGSWTISRDKPGAFMVPKGQSSSLEEAIERASRIQFANPYAIWYIYNRVEYAETVEYGLYPGDGPRTSGGYSTQAPEGMLRITIAEAGAMLDEALANVSGRA